MFALHYKPDDGRPGVDLKPHSGRMLEAEPLDHACLADCIAGGRHAFPLRISNASAPAAQTGLASDGPVTVRATMTIQRAPELFGLVSGGWLPFPFAARHCVLLDRNVISTIEKLRAEDLPSEKAGVDHPAWPWCAFHLAGANVSPMLYAYEGDRRRPPTEFEIRVSLQRAQAALIKVLPAAHVQSVSSAQRRALHQFLVDNSVRRDASIAFLQERLLLRASRTHGHELSSILVLAALSCLYDNAPALGAHHVHRPGRAVLKPSPRYTAQDAYNAVSDLTFLQLLVAGPVSAPAGITYVLYTRDVGLASLWAALEPRHFKAGPGSHTTGTLTLSRAMFPSLADHERKDLGTRLGFDDLKAR